jgi:CNP1-like family
MSLDGAGSWAVRKFAAWRCTLQVLGLALYSGLACAQLAADDPDWKESAVPAPPSFDMQRLVPFDVSINSPLKWGFDPETMTITGDGIVRYVVVAQSPSGVLSAMYEAVRCATGEWKTYARFHKDSGWTVAADPQWLSLRGQPSRHALRLAQQGLCIAGSSAQTVRDIVRNVKQQSPTN